MLATQDRSAVPGKPKQFRREGWVPVSFVGRDRAATQLVASAEGIKAALAAQDEHGRVAVSVGGTSRQAILKKLDYDTMRREILNVVFHEAADDDVMTVSVPVTATGHSEDTEAKGVQITQVLDHVSLRGRVASLPTGLTYDVSTLHVGHHATAGELELPAQVELLTPSDATLFTVQVIEEPDLSPELPPEVISRPDHGLPEGGADGGDEPAA